MVNRPLTVPRTAFLVLALVAATLLSLRSVCDQWFTHFASAAVVVHAGNSVSGALLHHDPAVQCCVSVSDPNLSAPLQAASGGLQAPQGLVPAVLSAAVASTAILARQLRWLRAPPRSPQSFYLRSARILR